MLSRTALTCNHYAAGCTKTEPKILQVKRGQKQRNAPGKARKRRNRVRSGCWRGVQPVRTGGETRNPNQNAPDSNATHEKKETGENPVFSPVLWQGQKDLVSAAASVGPGRSPPGCRPPRHAPQAGLRAHLVAKSYRTLTKKSGTAEAIPEPEGNCGLPSQPQKVHRGGSRDRRGRAPLALAHPTTRTAQGAAVSRCRVLMRANEK